MYLFQFANYYGTIIYIAFFKGTWVIALQLADYLSQHFTEPIALPFDSFSIAEKAIWINLIETKSLEI